MAEILSIAIGVIIIPALWILDAAGAIELEGEVIGVTIGAFTLIIRFFFSTGGGGGQG